MVTIVREPKFEKSIKKIKDKSLKEEIKKKIKKIIENPERTDFLRYERKGERKVYIRNFRLLYSYDKDKDIIYLIDFDKRSRVYER